MSDRRFLGLVEEAMPSAKGHWQPYTLAVAKGFEERGWQVNILGSGHREKDGGIAVEKVFSKSIWDNPFESLPQPVRLVAKLGFPWSWSREIQAHLTSGPRYSLLYAPNQLPPHLLAWSLALASKQADCIPSLALGVNYFGGSNGSPPVAVFRLQSKLARRLLMRHVKSGRLVFFCENELARQWLDQLFGWSFVLLPHAVDTQPFHNQTDAGKEQVHFVALGHARPDKGSDLLQSAIARALGGCGLPRAHFVLQWGDEATVGTSAMTKEPALTNSPQVEFIDSALTSGEVLALLHKAHFVILPYRNDKYYARLSRVAVEAVVNGIPVIYPKHSSIGEIVSRYGAGIEFENGSAESLTDALVRAVGARDSLQRKSRRLRQAAAAYHSGPNLARIVCEAFEFGCLPAAASAEAGHL